MAMVHKHAHTSGEGRTALTHMLKGCLHNGQGHVLMPESRVRSNAASAQT